MTSHDPTPRPVLRGRRVTLRPGTAADAVVLHAILGEDSVRRWWGEPDPVSSIEESLIGSGDERLLVICEADEVIGGIQYSEELAAMYRHAGIDVFLSGPAQGRGLGTEAVRLLARHLIADAGHHRLTIDPAADNTRAIRCYEAVGFRPVGVLRRYERAPDGSWRDGLLMDLLAGELNDD